MSEGGRAGGGASNEALETAPSPGSFGPGPETSASPAWLPDDTCLHLNPRSLVTIAITDHSRLLACLSISCLPFYQAVIRPPSSYPIVSRCSEAATDSEASSCSKGTVKNTHTTVFSEICSKAAMGGATFWSAHSATVGLQSEDRALLLTTVSFQ